MNDEYKNAQLYDIILFPFLRPIRKTIISIAKEFQYKTILDLCCGTGNQLIQLQKQGFHGTGVDLSDDMLKVAHEKSKNISFIKGNAEDLSFKDNSFDMVMTTLALHEKSRDSALKILDQMRRVIKKDGHLIIVDFNLERTVPQLSRKLVTKIESMTDDEHYGHYKNYCTSGGLDSLIDLKSLIEVRKIEVLFKAVTIRILTKK